MPCGGLDVNSGLSSPYSSATIAPCVRQARASRRVLVGSGQLW